MITLKDLSVTLDRRFDRIKQFDERSRSYRAVTEPSRPRSYTWRCNQWLDQGREGACVAFAIGHEMAARPLEIKGITVSQLIDLYWSAQKIDPWPGGAYPGATPKYEGTSVLAGLKAGVDRGWFAAYLWNFGLMDTLISLNRGPIVLGLNWYEGMARTDAAGFITPTGRLMGGHAILAIAGRIIWPAGGQIDRERSYVTLHNSWGPGWGINGRAKVRLTDLARLLDEDGESALIVGRRRTISA